jgi:hypothetical protein
LEKLKMTLILLAIVVLGLVSGGLVMYSEKGYEARHGAALSIGAFGLLATLGCAVIYTALGWQWIASEHKAAIINREYGTNTPGLRSSMRARLSTLSAISTASAMRSAVIC